MYYFPNEDLLMTSSKENMIKVWKLPKEWRDRNLEQEEEKEQEINRKTEMILNTQKKLQMANDDSDEDDLANWHKY